MTAFIVFEGGEGAGKSTQSRLLVERLQAEFRDVLATREPGGTALAEEIRKLVLDPRHAPVDARAEALLFAAARAQHVAQVIRPALDNGTVVVCDRYIDSSIAYQGVARGLGVDRIAQLSDWATGSLLPDLTIVLDVAPTLGIDRATARTGPDRMEAEDSAFHERVRQTYTDCAKRDPDRYLVLDAGRSIEELTDQIWKRVQNLI